MIEPKLRFKKDDGSDFPDWEEKKLGDVCDTLTYGMNAAAVKFDGENKYIRITDIDDESHCYKNDELVSPDGELDNKYLVCENDILLARTGASVGKSYLYNKEDGKLYYAGFLIKAHVKSENSKFIFFQTLTERYDKWVKITSMRSGQPGINANEYSDFTMNVPSLPEQQKIADFLSTIDTIIEKQRAMVLAWEERKKGVMQKLFSQEVRFKADDGSDFPDWEEKSFVNTFDSLNNSTFSRDCLNYENGSVKYIHYGDILVKYNSSVDVCDAIVPFVNEDLDCERFAILQDGDIVIADTAEDDTVGKVIEIENTSNVKTIAGLHTIACRPKEKFASKYLGYYMNSDEYHNQLRPYMQGIKVTSISKSNIALTKIMVPSLPEQQKIADCLSALDTVIQKQKETLEKWQELKKGLLQQMFV
ncbi:MAG: restriction endonuclease subunit S [Blautia hansenii]